ncbi:MAG TPA: hypothetical protein VMW66_05940 [Elusimicrobiales bacterium]|nr:hypothetical protein [Elusimicrobiales bacterium]
MEIDLLVHSTYNVEKIAKNKEFFNAFINKLKATYKLFSFSERGESNRINVSFAPTSSRIANVFIQMDTNGEIGFCARGNKRKLNDIPKGKHELFDYSLDTSLTIKGINSENYQEHLPTIVKAIEYCDYSFV